ncbi:hypothetical protein GINT2_000708 [Glugoides intestinalis]
MTISIINFKNKLDSSEATLPLQVDTSIDLTSLKSLLNHLLSRNSEYLFYYNDERFSTDLFSLIQKWSLSAEEEVCIHFIDTKDIQADHITECADVVISIEHFGGKIYYLTFEGSVFELGNQEELKYHDARIKGLLAGEKLFGFSKHSIFDIISGEEVYKFDEEIRCCSIFKKDIVIGSGSFIYILTGNTLKTIWKDALLVRDILVTQDQVIWIQEYDSIFTFDRGLEKTNTYQAGCSLTSLALSEKGIICTTANNTTIVITDKKVSKHDFPVRYSTRVEKYMSGFVFVSQHSVISMIYNETDGFIEKAVLPVNDQINSILIDNGFLYIANGNVISSFCTSRLKL